MTKVLMNGIELSIEFTSVESAKKYVASAKKIDKKYNSKNIYKIVKK